MYCPKCGKENPEDARFCGNCGEDLSIIVEETANKQPEIVNKKEEESSHFFKLLFSFGKKRKLVITFGIIILVLLPLIIFMNQEKESTAVETAVSTPIENAPTNFGTKLEFNSSELYYSSNVTYQQAERLGEYLVSSKFFADKKISTQFDKKAGVYVFRYVIAPGYENDESYLKIVSQYANEISRDVFSGAPVEINLTDSNFNTLVVVDQNYHPQNDVVTTSDAYTDNLNYYNSNPDKYGKMLEFNGASMYYTESIPRMDAQKIGLILTQQGFFDGSKKIIQLTKDGRVFIFRQIIPKDLERDRSVLNSAKSTAALLKNNVFGSRPFEVQLTDNRLKVLNRIKSGY